MFCDTPATAWTRVQSWKGDGKEHFTYLKKNKVSDGLDVEDML